ncbi:MAG: HAMP domain-containing protein [Thermodesulfobacteriota bacterium]|nr:HAMP domain-containing protein [Thermodesulfobacteriota bacterium]
MSKKNRKKIQRRQVYINRSFQTGFILKFCLILFLGGLISIALTYFTTSDTITSTFANSRLVVENTSTAILPSVVVTNLITTAVVLLIAVVVTLFVSHKIAGPMYRFEKDIQRISTGDLKSHIHIRDGDQFGEMVTSLNAMVDSLNSRVGAIKEEIDRLDQAAENSADREALKAGLKNLKKSVNSHFKS